MRVNAAAIRLGVMRALVFGLAFISFACLLGTFYGFWEMRTFACLAYVPAMVALGVIAWKTKGQLPARWIVQGAIGGLVAAIAYDLFRVPFVLNGAPLFKVFPRFGELLLGAAEPRWLVHTLGWSYHFSNGAALGIMFLALMPEEKYRLLVIGAILWAVVVEVALLLTPYARFFGLPLTGQFIALTANAHLIFGLTLGWWCRYRLAPVRS